ncbi:ParB/Srx family N-terminal domain-containing protein [Hyalangium rubrum]|uniref:ParB/Srx family N-terminal domain-containing protein n=1 Tax=Hyalangium rubrum TaxID=3103134 RepID=A0ABU5H7K6_9BACT|nr:ParB/Srx family N-terminal domain-containing protein [Hyalangium sp. s54d21]MDY7229461.1 ParB/Srx family N-terminal domain-containing protein [Hyalangium sp. s54d21]
MDAENRVDGEDGKPGTPEESPSANAQGEGAPASPEQGAAASEGPAGNEGGGSEGGGGEAAAEPGAAEAAVPMLPESVGEEAAVEPEPRSFGQVSLAFIPLEQVDEDATFRIRPPGEVSQLATDVARLGQLFPVDVRPLGEERYQIICGFRRLAALRFLKRDRVQARVHAGLSDEDALLMALAAAIHATPVDREELEAKRDQLESQGRLSAAARDMLEKALATEDSLAPESMEEEVDADELAADAAQRLGALNQDLSLLADVFTSLDESRRAELLMQLRYSAELVAYLEGL